MTVPFVWVAGAEGLLLPEEGGIPLGKEILMSIIPIKIEKCGPLI